MRLQRYFYLFVISLFMTLPVTTTAQNPIQTENEIKGTTKWQIPCSGSGCENQLPALSREIEGFASAMSVNKGETITFNVNLSDGSTKFDLQIYRMGWYQGNGGRLVLERTNIKGKHQPPTQSDTATGLIECNWTLPADETAANYQWNVPTTAVSGVYIVKLISRKTAEPPNPAPASFASYIIFVVRDDATPSDIVFQTSDTTWQAYNFYPGNRDNPPVPFPPNSPDPPETFTPAYSGMSLYNLGFGRIIAPGVKQGRRVSYNRPYLPDNYRIDLSAGQFFSWEYNMVRWLERNGYNVSYISNIDTHSANNVNNRFAPGKRKVFLSVGHDEYYSWEMRDNLEQTRNRSLNPMNLGFFSANTCFWQIRLEASGGVDNRIITAYKEDARHPTNNDARDPFYKDDFDAVPNLANNSRITNLWRKNLLNAGECPGGGQACYKQPEDELIGVQYSFPFNQHWNEPGDSGGVCAYSFCSAVGELHVPQTNCPTWLCNGMTAQFGYYNLGDLIGYEADRKFRDYAGRTLRIIGDSDVANINDLYSIDTGYNSHMTFFAMPGGGKVFAAGTIQYSWGLDDYSPKNYATDTNIHDALANSNAQNLTANMLNQCLLSGSACNF